ncbi:MAG: cache domain-containing protein [Promethearchaeota archaeon]
MRNSSLKTQMRLAFIIMLVFSSIIPIIYLSAYNSSENLQIECDIKLELLNKHTELHAIQFEASLEQLHSNFLALSCDPFIQEIVEYHITNSTLVAEFGLSENKTTGDFYPQRLRSNLFYTHLLEQFLNNFKYNPHILMIRVFSDNGNVLVGVVDGSEDFCDYKMDKSWFQDTIHSTDPNATFVSPISLSRILGVPVIRFSTPLIVENEIKGLLVVNYRVMDLVDSFFNTYSSINHFSCMLDPNYENAEGVLLGEVFIAHSLYPELCFNESNGGNIYFTEDMFDSLPLGEKGEIILDGQVHYFAYRKITFYQRDWYLVHVELAEKFSEGADLLKKNNHILLLIVVLGVVVLGTLLSLVLSHTIVGNEEKLRKSEEEVARLRKIFPICASCKKIRDHQGIWNDLEGYVSSHSEIDFSHSICPDCMKELYPDMIPEDN